MCLYLLVNLLFLLFLVTQAKGISEGLSDDQESQREESFLSRFRHSRHVNQRYNKYPSGTYQDLDIISDDPNNVRSGSLPVQSNHKPEFQNCSLYQPSIPEEEPMDTYVLTVKAVDRDPPDNGGTLNYTFVSATNEKLRFHIDPKTGKITTKHSFDRDEPYREKEVYMTVRVTDNGNPNLDDVCTIKITITDINDNIPVFDKITYSERVPQDLPVGQEVMRISATDIDDGKNSEIMYDLKASKNIEDLNYFRIDKNSGVIFLKKAINHSPGHKFKLRATASDQGELPHSSTIDLEIEVIESNKKPPAFTYIPATPIYLPENTSDFFGSIATLKATSNLDGVDPVFDLTIGRTEQTNKHATFRLESEGETAHIRLARTLDYELISDYSLTVHVQNNFNLGANNVINIRVLDVNDNIPVFTEVVAGSVLEDEPPGTPVMQVKAIDADSSPEHNQVTYELADNKDNFMIDPYTGNITTLKVFDRETQDFYNVKVIASDSSPSALFKNGEHNKAQQVFRIDIKDKNDHPPSFTQREYYADAIPEDANKNSLVAEVKAIDADTASVITYSIIEGNIHESFLIEESSGKIKVQNKLDYETIKNYTLKVRAFDGAFEDFCIINIRIKNVNDNPPQFVASKEKIEILEEQLVQDCVRKVEAYDPDIPDRSADQNITFVIEKAEQKKLFSIDNEGCLKLIKPLNRDPPDGFEQWQVLITANDNNGPGPDSLSQSTVVAIDLIDINDNAPFLSMAQPVIWQENKNPGTIISLEAKDNDTPKNGPPFNYSIDVNANSQIKSKFGISDSNLVALVKFDREEKKIYHVPITITDSGIPTMTGTSTLIVEIGDENDNAMEKGSSEIVVYKYESNDGDGDVELPSVEIGRVYVNDPDDWDLPDKSFSWLNGQNPNFDLNKNTGMITLLPGAANQSHLLKFLVTESAPPLIEEHSVEATVNVIIKLIPEEAVDKSGSLRLAGISAEEFISVSSNGESKITQLQKFLSRVLNTSLENVDVFTVFHSPFNGNNSELDIRFSAHGSPYYHPERINTILSLNQPELKHQLGADILMINIDECLQENKHCSNQFCVNSLKKSKTPYPVYSNTSSFIGINAQVVALCGCQPAETKPITVCHNGGTLFKNQCECPEGFSGPQCEVAAVSFNENGWALYPLPSICKDVLISVELQSQNENGLIFYAGPISPHRLSASVQDFISLELQFGFPVLLVDYGSGTVRLHYKHINFMDNRMHRIDILLKSKSVELIVDNCKQPQCYHSIDTPPPNGFLNVNGPLLVGGTMSRDMNSIALSYNWTQTPNNIGFAGCIKNITFNEEPLKLSMASLSENLSAGCNLGVTNAVYLGIDASFLLALLACLAILLILLVGVVVHRRKADEMLKDADDIRENIINYEDEGGGEGDMTGYDLTVLRLGYDDLQGNGKLPYPQISAGNEVPDICGFLDGKKNSVDNDPETGPFDDVRYYAYEGDGSTTGSLSSLASGTDEGDLNFDYLSNFGPRFRKLADMYGETDEEDNP